MINFIVTSYPSATTILGLKTSEKMNLFKRINTVKESKNHNFDMTSLIKEYSDTFGALGCLEEAHHIEIDPHVEPIVSPPRRVPLGQRKKLEQKLREMITQKVIVKVDEPTDWVNPMILVNKPNGDIRICMDPQRLNTAIKREHFQLPTMEELTMEMKRAQYFTKLDASSVFGKYLWMRVAQNYAHLRLHLEDSDSVDFPSVLSQHLKSFKKVYRDTLVTCLE